MIQLNYRDARPIYEQVRDGLRHLVVTGALQAGDKLPSVRALASSLACALDLAVTDLPERVGHVAKLNAELRAALSTYPLVRINSPEHAIPHVLNLSVRNVKGTVFQRELDAKGVCVSVKSACSSDGLPSRAVFAVSRDRRNALSSWRISLSHLTTEEGIKAFLQAFDVCYRELTAVH